MASQARRRISRPAADLRPDAVELLLERAEEALGSRVVGAGPLLDVDLIAPVNSRCDFQRTSLQLAYADI